MTCPSCGTEMHLKLVRIVNHPNLVEGRTRMICPNRRCERYEKGVRPACNG